MAETESVSFFYSLNERGKDVLEKSKPCAVKEGFETFFRILAETGADVQYEFSERYLAPISFCIMGGISEEEISQLMRKNNVPSVYYNKTRRDNNLSKMIAGEIPSHSGKHLKQETKKTPDKRIAQLIAGNAEDTLFSK